MKISFPSVRNLVCSERTWLMATLAILLAAPMGPAMAQSLPKLPTLVQAAAANTTKVPLDQQPLTIQPSVPPDIMLMFDDSGSMAWDYMPDWSYISDTSDNGLRDYKINGTYYNPSVIYTPPPMADGGVYPNSPSMGGAYKNGFNNTDTTDVTKYNDDYPYYTKIKSEIEVGLHDPKPGCKPGDDYRTYGSHDGKCHSDGGYKYTYYDPKVIHHKYGWTEYACEDGDYKTWDNDNKKYMCVHREYIDDSYYDPSSDYPYCPQGKYDPTTKKCIVTDRKTAYLFTYTSKSSSGSYDKHYVGKNQQDCAIANAGDPSSDCDYSDETKQNVANWFSYYRTRILLAKTGLMNAFSGMKSTVRFGFGSLHNNGGFPSGIDLWCGGSGSCSRNDSSRGYEEVLAQIQPFGDGSVATDQKSKFWQWVADAKPNNGTPLRSALQYVGKYYQTDQPWKSLPGDPGYVDDGTNKALACRQSYTIMTTDGFWNSGSTNVGNADNSSDAPKIKGPNDTSYTYSPEDPFKDSNSNTLADVAMYYWDHDLQSGIDNEVPTNDADKAFWQHMVTFTIGMGFLPQYKNKSGGKSTMTEDMVNDLFTWAKSGNKPDGLGDWNGWLTPSGSGNGILNNINDLVHAAVNGHGGFFSATNPQTFANGLRTALNRASARSGTAASLAANSTQLKTGTAIYQSYYHTVAWTGDLLAYGLKTNGDIEDNPSWSAASKMPAASDRHIYTVNTDTGASVAFVDSGSGSSATPPTLATAQLTALGSDAATQAAMVSYLRGATPATGSWRTRSTSLGDIVDSQPVFVGPVDPNEFVNSTFTGSGDFAQFASDQNDRAPRVYVAANDGMLHAFNAATCTAPADGASAAEKQTYQDCLKKAGTETYAFLPGTVITAGISDIANPAYGTATLPHRYFNDGQLTVADAYFAEGTADAAWHSILVGTTGRGASKTIYALDITDPASIVFLWERSAGDGKDNSDYIGQMVGKPIIAQVGDGKWAVLMGNGYNSTKNTAALLQFKLSTGALTVYTTNADSEDGLAGPAVWMGDKTNGVSTAAYAGDLKGHVWEFNLAPAAAPATPAPSGTVSPTPTPAPDTTGTLLYTATDPGGTAAQPITAGMLIGKDPKTQDLWVFFGTGRYLAASDLTGTNAKQVQTLYGLIVQSATANLAVTSASTRTDLAQRKIIAQFAADEDRAYGTRVVSLPHSEDDTTPDISGKSGWYLDLKTPTMGKDSDGNPIANGYTAVGERVTVPIQFEGSLLLSASLIPTSTGICNPSGSGAFTALDPFTGTNPTAAFFDISGNGKVNSSDTVNVGGKTVPVAAVIIVASGVNGGTSIGSNIYYSTTTGGHGHVKHGKYGNGGERVSWREMVNP